MTENKYTGMMYAYALGCLNQADYSRLLNLMVRGEEYPYQDLGEFQNLTALLPSILQADVPPKSVKENIARQLYYIKDQAKEKKVTPVTASGALQEWGAQETETRAHPEISEPEKELAEVQEVKTDEAEPVETTYEPSSNEVPEIESVPEIENQATVRSEEETAPVPQELVELEEKDIPETGIVETLDEKIKQIEEEISAPEAVISEPEPPEETAPPAEKEKAEVPAAPEIPKEVTPPPKEEVKTLRSLGDFLADAEIKPEETTGKIEFEDYFAQAKKAEVEKRAVAPPRPRAPKTETMVSEPPVRKVQTGRYSESGNYRKSSSPTGTIVTLLLIILTAAILYYYFNAELELFQTDNKKMSEELLSVKGFTTISKEILGILSEKDSRMFNLSGGNQNSYSFGKVIYSPSENKGFIHAGSLPELKENMSYQFWINIGGRNYMIHRFTAATKQDFYPFSLQTTNLNQYMRVFLTEEPYTGSESPSRTVLLSGTN